MKNNTTINDSIIDRPKEGLCLDIWEKVFDNNGVNEIWKLKDDVRQKLLDIASHIFISDDMVADKNYPLRNKLVHITGSITSNLYTKKSDIDLHLLLANGIRIKELPENTQARFRSHFESLKKEHPEFVSIGNHPIEIYFQPNEFQDYMSVGCYDVLTNTWLVGPEFKDLSYNPYGELYQQVKITSESLVQDIRNTILKVYERAIVMLKADQFEQGKLKDFSYSMESAWVDFKASMKDAAKLYDSVRKSRKVYSDPKSIDQALKFRNSTKWKIADAAFKLMDKFGYLAILKEISSIVNNSLDSSVCIELAHKVISIVKTYIGNADKLAEQEKTNKIKESYSKLITNLQTCIEKFVKSNIFKMYLSESKNGENEKYVEKFKNYFGYSDEYTPKETYEKLADKLAHECALRMPTDTEAQEIEGDAVMLLVLSGEEEAVEVGKKLGDCMSMMKKGKHNEETLLKLMSDAYKALTELRLKFERKQKLQQEAIKKLFKNQILTEELNCNDKQLTTLPNTHYIVKFIERVAKDCELDSADEGPKIDSLEVDSVQFYNDNIFVTVFGGANGGKIPGKCSFQLYLALLRKFITKLLEESPFDNAWLVDWKNDCCDDVWTLKFGLEFYDSELQNFLSRTKIEYSNESLDEGLKDMLSIAAIAGLLSIPNILPAKALAAEIKQIPEQKLQINSPEIKTAINNSILSNKKYGTLNAANAVNALTRTIFDEARGENKVGMDAVASVIWNRAGGNAQKIIKEISRRKQFSCWNSYNEKNPNGWTDKTYIYYIPYKLLQDPNVKECWDYSMELAIKLLNEDFKSTMGNYNSYLNKNTASKEAIDEWGYLCTHKLGNHWFGYQKCWDGFKKYSPEKKVYTQTTIYIVKPGDTLEKIAKKFKIPVSQIILKNKLKNPNSLKVDQKLKINY